MEQCIVCISKATYPLSLTHLVVKQQIQEVIHTLSIGSHFDSEGNNPPSPEKVGHTTDRGLRSILFPV